jgi:single-stranded DNA-specific DHH superfamily exonuclease
MIPEEKIAEIRKAFTESARPLIFFDDDADGLCSFLQFYKLNTDTKGVIYKVAGPIDEKFLKKVEEYQPDNIFILDVPVVTQDFLDKANNVYWLDHHAPVERKHVKYFNPMIESRNKDNRPTSYWAYQVTKSSLWLAMAGCIGDWYIPEDLRKEFSEKYSDLLPEHIKKPEEALFNSEIGKLAQVFSFMLKGTTKDAMACVKVMTRIHEPYEILEQSTSNGKFIWKKYKTINKIYQEIKGAMQKTDDDLLVYIYPEGKMALTSELSNEVLYENPEKFVIIGREKNGEMKISLRSTKHEVLHILQNALKDVHGYGGGHLHACGANVKKEDFERFLESIRKQL